MSKTSTAILRPFSKLTSFATIFLIFAGGLVTSTGSGLSVPDWPLSYGMVFPPMVGGVFYEHGHRMVATVVGFLTLCLTVMIWKLETRRWLKNLAVVGLMAVIIQGILGGMTVKMMLPIQVSVSHGVLAQSFLVLTVFLAYSFSKERENRSKSSQTASPLFLRVNLLLLACIFLQLIFGAIMRHSHSGLAIPDFPTVGGEWWPALDQQALNFINEWRFEHNLEPVTQTQVFYHFLHRVGALIIAFVVAALNFVSFRNDPTDRLLGQSLFVLNLLVILQITLGIVTVVSIKEYHLASLHVATGAVFLAWSALLFFRAAPTKLRDLKEALIK